LKSLEALADDSPELAIEKILSALKIVTISITIFFTLAGLYYIRLSILILRTNEFPPSGIRVVKDTSFVTGKDAQRRGIGILIFAILLIVIGLLFPIYMNKIFQILLL
ncbi:MAG: hypothetical protein KAT74_10280, partial [Candidatus Cloacimonetes bacterium]|nr:hypothetical protein [Candidatus Cloacimonadota bacterium]